MCSHQLQRISFPSDFVRSRLLSRSRRAGWSSSLVVVVMVAGAYREERAE